MIEIAGLNDDREEDPDKYLIDWNDKHSRQTAFLRGWTIFLNDGEYNKVLLHWQTVGAYYASILGDIDIAQRRKLYYAALAEYVKSVRCSHWSEGQRQEALRRARQAPGF